MSFRPGMWPRPLLYSGVLPIGVGFRRSPGAVNAMAPVPSFASPRLRALVTTSGRPGFAEAGNRRRDCVPDPLRLGVVQARTAGRGETPDRRSQNVDTGATPTQPRSRCEAANRAHRASRGAGQSSCRRASSCASRAGTLEERPAYRSRKHRMEDAGVRTAVSTRRGSASAPRG